MKNIDNDIGIRLKNLIKSDFMKEKGIKSQEKFCDIVGLSRNNLANYMYGRRTPTMTTINLICKTFPEVNVDWLAYGEGEMLNDYMSEMELSDLIYDLLHNQSPKYVELVIKTLNRLTPEQIESVVNMIDAFTGTKKDQ